MTDTDLDAQRAQREGLLAALIAYVLWGLFPIYFILVASVAPFEVPPAGTRRPGGGQERGLGGEGEGHLGDVSRGELKRVDEILPRVAADAVERSLRAGEDHRRPH